MCKVAVASHQPECGIDQIAEPLSDRIDAADPGRVRTVARGVEELADVVGSNHQDDHIGLQPYPALEKTGVAALAVTFLDVAVWQRVVHIDTRSRYLIDAPARMSLMPRAAILLH